MQTRTMQKGMTFWGLLVVFALIVFFTVLTLKLLPPYIEYGKVKTALENIAKQPEAGNMERSDIKAALDRRSRTSPRSCASTSSPSRSTLSRR